MKENNLDHFLNEVSAEYKSSSVPFDSFEELKRLHRLHIDYHHKETEDFIEKVFREGVSRYANHVKAIALQEGRNEGFAKGCALQKVECAKAWDNCHDPDKDFDSILNAPDAVKPFITEKKQEKVSDLEEARFQYQVVCDADGIPFSEEGFNKWLETYVPT